VLHGPAGIGKSAVALEFVHFATAPGRLFSCAPLILRLTSLGGLEEAIAEMEEQVEGLARRLGVLLRPASANSRMSDLDSSRSDSGGGTAFSELTEASDLLSTQVLARSRIRRGLQQIERRQPAAKVLCIVDDAAGAVAGSANMRWLFGDLIEHTRHLHFLILSREPIYADLGNTKMVNEALGGLTETDAARLFLQRIHRQLEPRDLERQEAQPAGRSPVERVLGQLRGHPLLKRLNGHPGHICTVSSSVVPGGASLYELAAQADLLEPQPLPAPLQRMRSMPPLPSRGSLDESCGASAQGGRPYSASPCHAPNWVDLR